MHSVFRTSFIMIVMTIMIVIAAPSLPAAEEGLPEQNQAEKKKGVSVTFGGMAYYADWQPFWRKDTFTDFVGVSFRIISGNYTSRSSSFVYGALFSVQFADRWSISTGGLYGTYTFDFSGLQANTSPAGLIISAAQWKRSAQKFDIDLLVQYNINQYFKFFFGIKYQGYEYNDSGYTLVPGSSFPLLPVGDRQGFNSFGPALGFLSLNRIAGSWYLQNQVSIQGYAGIVQNQADHSTRIIGFLGGNLLSGLACHITPAHLTISLGGRLQYQYYIKSVPRYSRSRNDLFYGLYASLMATF